MLEIDRKATAALKGHIEVGTLTVSIRESLIA
jgi:hypothetical protein